MRAVPRALVGLVCAMVVAQPACAATGPKAREARVGHVIRVFYDYTASETGQEDAYGYNPQSVFLPRGLVLRVTHWVSWSLACSATKAGQGAFPARGTDLSCANRKWQNDGRYGLIRPFEPQKDCVGDVSPFRQVRWGVGALVPIHRGAADLHVDIGPLNYNVVPNNCASEAVHWFGDLSTDQDVPNLFRTGSAVLTRDVYGDYPYPGEVGSTHFHSTLVVQANVSTFPLQTLAQWSAQIAQWITEWQDSQNQRSAPPAPNPAPPPAPTVFSPKTGGMTVSVQDLDPVRLLTLHQQLRAGAPTQLHLRLTAAGRRQLASLTDSATLLIKIAFKPKHRRAVKLTRTLTAPPIQPVISSVQFVGQPSNPKIIVRGKGLGKRPARNPSTSPAGQNGCPSQTGNYGFDYGTNLSITDSTGDSTGDWSAGRHLPSFGELDCIGIVPTKFTSGEVDFGLGSFYTGRYPQFSLSPGDDVQVVVNGAVIDVHVQYGPPVTS